MRALLLTLLLAIGLYGCGEDDLVFPGDAPTATPTAESDTTATPTPTTSLSTNTPTPTPGL